MPRVLTCIDPSPLPEGECQQTAWIEQRSLVDMLPTLEQANQVGAAVFLSLMTLAVLRALTKPPREE